MSRYDELTSLVEGLGSDFAKFYDKGNKSEKGNANFKSLGPGCKKSGSG